MQHTEEWVAYIKHEILDAYRLDNLTEDFEPQSAIYGRVQYLKRILRDSNRNAYILGISGGVDSSVTGKLCQMACEELRNEGYDAEFVAMRLPAGIQADEQDAQDSLKFINPDKTLTVNVGLAASNLSAQGVAEFSRAEAKEVTPEIEDWHKGNIKARLRMVAQYQIAGLYKGLVVGTDHNAECIMGFYTLHGDGACDLTVLNGLNKRQIRLIAKHMGAPESVWSKPPTADLEELKPGKLDDDGFGVPYDSVDDFLEGKKIPFEHEKIICEAYDRTRFKRRPPYAFCW